MKGLKTILGICLATAGLGGAIAVGAVSVEASPIDRAEAADKYSGSIVIQKDDNDMKWDGCNLVAYLFNSGNSTWGPIVQNTSNDYQEYSWTDLSFNPTTAILLRVPTNWSSSWDNPWWDGSGGIYCRTGNITISNSSVVWIKGNATESSNWGTFEPDAVVKGGASDNWSVATVSTALSTVKVNSSNHLEVYGAVSLPANTYFKVLKETNTWCGTYSAHSSIQSNLSGGGNSNIHNTKAATYEFYFDWVSLSTYITDPVEAAADEWAQYFLAHVGCDSNGVNLPTGWSTCATEYGKLSGDVKNRIYGAEAKESGTFVEQAVARYDKAISSHPSLTKFIVNSSDTPRATNNVVITTKSKENNIAFVVVTAVAIAALSTGAYLLLRKKKHN